MITLRTLGECVVEVDGTPYGPDADTAFAALVYLAAERGRHLSRQQVAELFWPGCPAPRARHSLRQLLYRLRALRVPVEATRERIWVPERVVSPTFSAEPTLARLREAQAQGTLVVGPYLPGYVPAFSPAFREWLDGYRSVVEGQVRRALLDAADEHRMRGEWAERDAVAREVLRLDPLNQAATIARAECAAMTGAVTEAITILERYESELGPEHGELVRPTVALRRQIAEHFPARRYRIPSDRCFVGREALMSALTVALLRARNREGSAVLLWGAPGIGKTRLASELTSLALMQGLRVVQVQGEESDTRQPMAAFVDAVPQLLRLSGALGVAPEAMPFLRRLTEFDPTLREPSPEARDPQYLAGRIRQAIVDLVDAVAGEGPLVMLFEDVHWMDAASWTTLRTLIEWNVGKRVLILLTSRRPHATASPPQRELARLEVREVGALDETASAALVRAIAEDYGAPLPDGAEAWCGAVGEGNPLFLRELAVHCLEGGQPRAVPPSVQTLLDARIARLRPAARRVLQASGILGEHATIERLDRVLEMPAHELVGALDDLTEAALVAGQGPAVRPRHELVAARVAAVTSGASRRLLHRRAAVVLESEVLEGATIDLMWACAGHWQATGNPSRGLQLAISAAGQLIELGLPNEAITVCERAAILCDSPSGEFALIRLEATAHSLSGHLERAATAFAALATREVGIVPHPTWANDMLAATEVDIRARGCTAEAAATAARFAADSSLDVNLRLRAALVAVKAAGNVGDETVALWAWESVCDLEPEQIEVQSVKLLVEMIYHLSMGDVTTGCAAARRLTTIQSHAPQTFAAISTLMNLAEAFRICGDLRVAAVRAAEAFAVSERHNASYAAAWAACNAAEIALAQDDLDAARRWYDAANRHAQALNDRRTNSTLIGLSARIMLAGGDADAALAIAAAHFHQSTSDVHASPVWQRSALTTLAECYLAATDGPLEPWLLDALSQAHRSTQRHPLHDRTATALYQALVRAGRNHAAAHLADSYIQQRRGGPIDALALFPLPDSRRVEL